MSFRSTPAPDPVESDRYRLALLNGGHHAPTHDIVRVFEEASASPRFEAAAFSALADLLDHLDASARRGAETDVVLIGPGPEERLAAARTIRERDGRVQIILLVPEAELLRFRRAILFSPLLGDVWTADVADAAADLRTLARDAAEGTRRRRGVAVAVESINRQLQTPQGGIGLAEERLFVSQRYLASLLTHAPDAIVSSDLDGRIVSWNDAASRVFGQSVDQAIGAPLSSLFPRRNMTEVRRLFERVRDGEALHQHQVTCRRADDSAFFGEITLAPVHDEGGLRIGISMIARDVTARVREREALEEAKKRLQVVVEELRVRTVEAEAASRAKSEFLATISHELRTPLQAIIGYVALMEEGVVGTASEAQAAQLERIRSSADHLLVLVEQVLQLTRRDVEPLQAEERIFDLYALVEGAVGSVRREAEASGLELALGECPDDRLRRMRSDPTRIRQILFALLSNAVKFTESGSVTVTLEVADARRVPEIVIHVEDTGIGLTADEIDRVFDPFFQARSGFSRPAGGLGLGLPLSRRLAERMGGRLEVRSAPGRGSRFSLALPFRGPEGR